MLAEWKLRTAGDLNGETVLIARIRTEHQIVLKRDSLPRVMQAIGALNQVESLDREDLDPVSDELGSIVRIFREMSDGPTVRAGLESDWAEFNTAINLDVIKKLDDELKDLETLRFEGSPETGYRFITTAGVTVGSKLIRTSQEATQFKQEIEKVRVAYSAAAVAGGLAAVAAGGAALAAWATGAEKVIDVLTAWERYQEQKEKARKARDEAAAAEQARREASDKARDLNRDTGRVGGGAGGGLERAIGRM